MKIKYIKSGECDGLKANIAGNVEKYSDENSWLKSYFSSDNWTRESNYHIPDNIELLMPEGKIHHDIENTKIIYTALKDLPISVVIDERFWAYLTHVTFWLYMRKRWPVENAIELKDGPSGYIREHYFFMPNKDRALIRNGVSRLWWYGFLSYDENRSNPFELTEALLEKLDIAQQLLERTYSRNPTITKTILSLLIERKNEGKPFSHREKQFRPLMTHLNNLGGVTILDALMEEDIRQVVEVKLEQLSESDSNN